ncbi:MAG: pyruvate synthase subunit beta [Spirochaetes bacterium]|nr:MAG: pyruvate synthase subunit beta [Spirochaetota bacterium]
MNTIPIYAPLLLDKKEYLTSGHRACQGCAEALAVRLVMKALGRDTIVAMATGCMEIISSSLPTTAWQVPWIHVAFENAPAVITGCESGMKAMMRKKKIREKKINFVSMGGDGATADIGMGQLSGAMERGHNCIYICYDNEAYMNTGIQRSSSTPYGATTTTTPAGHDTIGQMTNKKNMPKIAVAHEIPYVATACPSYPFDLIRKLKKASEINGPAYIHIMSVCPTGWRIDPDEAIKYGRLIVESCVFPLYEVENGEYYINYIPEKIPVKEYLKGQGRFRHLKESDIGRIQERVDKEYSSLLKIAKTGDSSECK